MSETMFDMCKVQSRFLALSNNFGRLFTPSKVVSTKPAVPDAYFFGCGQGFDQS